MAAAVLLAWHISLSSTRRCVGWIPLVVPSCATSVIRRWKGWGRLHQSSASTNTPISIYSLGCVRLCVASRCRWLRRETGIGFLEEIVARLRHPYSEPPPSRERFITGLPEGHPRDIFRLSSQSLRSQAADHPFFGLVGGRDHKRLKVSEPDAGRGENAVWDMNVTSGPRSVGCPSTSPEDC